MYRDDYADADRYRTINFMHMVIRSAPAFLSDHSCRQLQTA